MSENQKKPTPEIQKNPPLEQAGVLKEKDKLDLESRITETLKRLNGKLTKKDIDSLLSRIETTHSLEGMRKELVKEKKLDNVEISDELLQSILDLIGESREVAKSHIEELKLELSRLNPSPEYTIDNKVYLTNKFPWIKKLEESPLGKNIVLDIAGIAVGALDSAQAILKLLLWLLTDLIKLPGDVVKLIKKDDEDKAA